MLRNTEDAIKKWQIQINWQHKVHKTKTTKKNNTNIHNVNKTWALLQTTGNWFTFFIYNLDFTLYKECGYLYEMPWKPESMLVSDSTVISVSKIFT